MKQFTIELCTEYANLCDGVIAPSESIARLISERGVRSPIAVIPTGIDVVAFGSGNGTAFRRQTGIPSNAFVFGHLGRLAPEKNLRFLARAICQLLHRTPRAVFLVVGSGPSAREIREIFEAEGLAQRLFLPGAKTGQDLYDAYAAMDVFVFSSCSETQGLVVAEAMAAGLPVVALDAPGAREVVRDCQNGFLLPASSSESDFSERIARLESDPGLTAELKNGAIQTAAHFSKDACAARALEWYETIRLKTQRRHLIEAEDSWASLLKQLEVEWDLLMEKTKAAMHAFLSDSELEKPNL